MLEWEVVAMRNQTAESAFTKYSIGSQLDSQHLRFLRKLSQTKVATNTIFLKKFTMMTNNHTHNIIQYQQGLYVLSNKMRGSFVRILQTRASC